MARPSLTTSAVIFALAKASDDLKNFAEAFRFYAEGNVLRKKQLGYDKQQDIELFDRLRASHPSIATHSLQLASVVPKQVPIFIIGMPRSGTTLVEQIISSHSRVRGAGELPFAARYGGRLAIGDDPVSADDLMIFREQYLNALQQRLNGSGFVTDKMPQNFRFVGLIAAAFPESKLIHVKRDPAAVCWANFKQHFVKESLGYAYSLDDIVHYHELYRALMEYWDQTLSDRIYDLDYELLTSHQEKQTRKLLAYLDLEWDAACMSPQYNKRAVATASKVQVRQKVYQGSSEKWKRYRPYLDGALDHFSVRI